MVYVCFYLVLIVGLPFFLLWAGIEENTLFYVIIPIYASVLGGALALAGVAWTIQFTKNERMEQDKKRDEERREEERKRCVPYVQIVSDKNQKFLTCFIDNIDKLQNFKFENFKSEEDSVFYLVKINDFLIKNISEKIVIIKGLFIDEYFFPLYEPQFIAKNEICKIHTTGNSMLNRLSQIKIIELCLEDVVGNAYKCRCRISNSFLFEQASECVTTMDGKKYHGFMSLCKVEQIELPRLIKEPTNE